METHARFTDIIIHCLSAMVIGMMIKVGHRKLQTKPSSHSAGAICSGAFRGWQITQGQVMARGWVRPGTYFSPS